MFQNQSIYYCSRISLLRVQENARMHTLTHTYIHSILCANLISIHRLRGCGRSNFSTDRSGSTWSMGPTPSAWPNHGPMGRQGRGRRKGHSCRRVSATIVCILAAWRVLVGWGGIATAGVTAHCSGWVRNRVHITTLHTTVHVRLNMWGSIRVEERREGGREGERGEKRKIIHTCIKSWGGA